MDIRAEFEAERRAFAQQVGGAVGGLTFGSLFAGIGGFDLGFERGGMRCLWQVEKDEFCRQVLAKHWPDVERFEDVREVGKHNLETADVICGGFPCQPHSVAGQRRGADDDRNLWSEYRRIVAELRPAYVVGENVPGIKSTILDQVLSDLENLDYTTATFVIPACAVDAPHRRDRIFIVAHTDRQWQSQPQGAVEKQRGRSGNGGQDVPDADGDNEQRRGGYVQVGRQQQPGEIKNNGYGARKQWPPEPGVGRVVDGVPNRVDRLKSLGNAVVPQLAEFIGRLIVAHAIEKRKGL